MDPKSDLQPDRYPQLSTFYGDSAHRTILTPDKIFPPEFVYLPHNALKGIPDNQRSGFIALWNASWESGPLRPQLWPFRSSYTDTLLSKLWGQNIYLLLADVKLHHAMFAPLYQMLPLETLNKFGLPPLLGSRWPFSGDLIDRSSAPSQVKDRLSRAFAYHVWPHLNSGSSIDKFDASESIRVLAHNLDFWLPYAYRVAEDRLRCPGDPLERFQKVAEEGQNFLHRNSGPIWRGEADAKKATRELIDQADKLGKLRSIIDAIKSNRVEDDFSSRWSYAKEDFERKLFRKRAKVNFVEIEDTPAVHGPESEVYENIIWEDFMALLDRKEKRIVICLRNGMTKHGDIAKSLGYKTHSPITKKLAKIRDKALKMLED